jgi:translation initiation factor 1
MSKDWKDRLGVVYSTNADFQYEHEREEEHKTLKPEQQILKVSIDRKQRRGKTVTIISGFIGRDEDLKNLGKKLKTKCGVGGSVKEGDIIIQGEWLKKVNDILQSEGYKVK